ncbi:MAG: biotin--[acetyl-CoA-carboxylase] ligase [Bryobacterales bacterium]|nr:biotin--[acetyl-CoA-carboxylase] ligase [Bryobacterales bacterium]
MMFDIEAVAASFSGRLMLWLDSTDSTMLDAARLAEGGVPSGSLIGAEEQTAGQGRHGHSWHSPTGTGLYFSQVLRLNLPAHETPIVTMALGVAVAEAITQATGLAVDLRWPNDIMLNGRKAVGILVQQHNGALITGIGINVNQESFPPDIGEIATSLRIANGGRPVPREALLLQLLPAIDRMLEVLTGQGKDAILRLFSQASSYVSGRRVVVEQGDRQLRGTTDGMDENGFLMLREDNGTRTRILAGGVRPE